MRIEEFWNYIDSSRGGEDVYQQANEIVMRLSSQQVDDILDFNYWWHIERNRSYLSIIWIAAILINQRVLLDDEFEYFIGWLMLQGRVEFDRVVADPDRLATSALPAEPSYEGYPAYDAWLAATSSSPADGGWERFASAAEERHGDYFGVPELDEPLWYDDEAQIRVRLPMLAARFGRGGLGT